MASANIKTYLSNKFLYTNHSFLSESSILGITLNSSPEYIIIVSTKTKRQATFALSFKDLNNGIAYYKLTVGAKSRLRGILNPEFKLMIREYDPTIGNIIRNRERK